MYEQWDTHTCDEHHRASITKRTKTQKGHVNTEGNKKGTNNQRRGKEHDIANSKGRGGTTRGKHTLHTESAQQNRRTHNDANRKRTDTDTKQTVNTDMDKRRRDNNDRPERDRQTICCCMLLFAIMCNVMLWYAMEQYDVAMYGMEQFRAALHAVTPWGLPPSLSLPCVTSHWPPNRRQPDNTGIRPVTVTVM